MKVDFDKKFYEEIIEKLNDGLYIVDTNRVIKFWNKASERITGFSAEEVVGSSCSDNILMHV
ncbi:PAS domain-containing protein, partial [Thermovirga sp.]|uniref:PAS domain-containing protein n=1 Tax=Thermovirga sp. TaxID=2699834 RepID=UPI0025E78B4C